MRLSFKDRVRTLEPQGDRREVTFRQRAARYWIAGARELALAALQEGLAASRFVDVDVDGSTNEVVSAALAP